MPETRGSQPRRFSVREFSCVNLSGEFLILRQGLVGRRSIAGSVARSIESTAGSRSATRHLATSAEKPFVRAVSGRMVCVSRLLAGGNGFLLIGSHEAFSFLHGLFADLPHLLILLLWRERGVGTDSVDLRMGIVNDGPDLLHHGPFKARLLEAVFMASGPVLRGRSRRRRSALRQQRSCANQKNNRAEKFLQHD